MNVPVLSLDSLSVTFDGQDGPVYALRGVSLEVFRGEILAVVGESGCGKSVLCLAALGLLPRGACVDGSITFRSTDLLRLSGEERRKLRGSALTMVFQDPLSALNPFLTIERQVAELFEIHAPASRPVIRERVIHVLERAGLADAARKIRLYPHELSGGMRQRVLIAMAFALRPDVVFADEPTTALDVVTQAGVLDFLKEEARAAGSAVVLVTHDLGVVAAAAQRMAVFYAGQIVEYGETRSVIHDPAHPYTRSLLNSSPSLVDQPFERLNVLEGRPFSALRTLDGCAFFERCHDRRAECSMQRPELEATADGRLLRCPVVRERIRT